MQHMAYGIFVKIFSTKRNSLIKKKLDVTGKIKKLYTTIKTAILLNPVTFFLWMRSRMKANTFLELWA